MILAYHKSDELYHHGILGQEWGKRNGPPYPLSSDDHSAAEKKAGWKKSLGSGKIVVRRKNAGKAEVRKSGSQQPNSKYQKNRDIQSAVRRAKNEDKWDMDFLEYTQNEDYANSNDQKSKDRMLKEYESYLENSDEWLSNLRKQHEQRPQLDKAINEQGDMFNDLLEHEKDGKFKKAIQAEAKRYNVNPEALEARVRTDYDKYRNPNRATGKIGDPGDILSEKDEKRFTKFMNDIERNGQEIVNEIFGGKNNAKYPNRDAMAARAKALRKQGLTNEQIAKKLGYDSPSAVSSLVGDTFNSEAEKREAYYKNSYGSTKAAAEFERELRKAIKDPKNEGRTWQEVHREVNEKMLSGSRKSGSQMQLFKQQDNKRDNAEARESASIQNSNYNISYDKNENLSEARRQVIDLRKKGYTNNEIKEIMGLTKSDDVNKISEYLPTSDKGAEKRYNINRGYTTVKDAKNHKHDYSTEDLKDIVARYDAEKSVNAAVKEINDAKKKKVLDTIRKVTEVSNTVYDAANSIDKWAKLLSPSDNENKKKK